MAPTKRKIATNIPADLLKEATTLSGLNQTTAILEGLRELIGREKRKRLLGLRGKPSIDFDPEVSRGWARRKPLL